LPVDEALALIAQAGFHQIETCGPQGYFERWEYRPVTFMRAKLERAGLRVRTVHVPVKGWALGDPDDTVRTRAVDAASASLTHAALVGAELVVLHPNAWRGSTDRAEYAAVQQRSNEDIATLAECAELAEHLRELENQRLDELQASLWDKALAGVLPAADRILRIMERRAKLNGLDAPQKIAPTDPTGENPYLTMSDTELRALAAQILEADHD